MNTNQEPTISYADIQQWMETIESNLNAILEHIRDSKDPFAGSDSFQLRRGEILRHTLSAKSAFYSLDNFANIHPSAR